VDTEQIRQTAKAKWLDYYQKNRHWINNLQVWITCDDVRRPLSSFILGALGSVDQELTKLLPLLVELNSDPDQLIRVLGLNFDPDKALENLAEKKHPEHKKMLPPSGASTVINNQAVTTNLSETAMRYVASVDSDCEGVFKGKKKSRLPFEP
jgi:Family of unknown function (DUF5331)